MQPAKDPTLFERFAFFIRLFAEALGYGCTRATPQAHILIVNLFHRRLQRTLRRFKRFLMAPDPTALNPKPRQRRQVDPEAPKPDPHPPRPDDKVYARSTPRQFAWLRRIIPDHIITARSGGAAAGRLLELLRDPEMQDLLRRCPTLARDLRPLCHALGIRFLDTLYNTPLPFPALKPRKRPEHPPNTPFSPSRHPKPLRAKTSLNIMPPVPRKIAL